VTLEQLLAKLVRIPSPNPAGDTRQIAKFIADFLATATGKLEILSPIEKPEAQSVVATLGEGKPVIMLHAHIDTVPISNEEAKRWSSDPYEPTIKDGRLYGKGSIDDKAPLAAMMWAFKKLAAQPFRGTLVLVAAAEEETGGQLGTHWLADQGHLPECDFIIVGEQTDNRIALAHKGVMRATVTTYGHSVHATNPDRGVNAITAMARVILALENYHRDLSQRKHPLVGTPTCNVGTIQGGSTANAVPDSCSIRLDRRMIPREDPEAVQWELQNVIAAVNVSPASVEVGEFLFSSWFDSKLETPYGKAFFETVRQHKDPGPVGYLPGSDAKHLMNLAKDDMVIFGPGSYEVAHAFDEYVEISALLECEEVLSQFLRKVFIEGV
jgi:acetylornithine deacetylase/succinyl-diaminopimelate desuccinylase family protein